MRLLDLPKRATFTSGNIASILYDALLLSPDHDLAKLTYLAMWLLNIIVLVRVGFEGCGSRGRMGRSHSRDL